LIKLIWNLRTTLFKILFLRVFLKLFTYPVPYLGGGQ